LERLRGLLASFEVVVWMTDGWPLYEPRLKGKLHVISKRYTQRIGRHNLNLRATVAKLAMRQPFVLFKGLTFQKLCLPGAFRPGDHHNKMLRPGLCVVHASPQYL
ncbi:IS1 family transposase, partial [Klebsiella pneumoniae]|uniref:IS1 family transposase n=1 Tax=Klebsiella pneumoniae TaxID=573 RepID=UPI003D2B5C13